MREKPDQQVLAQIQEAGHVNYPYAKQERFSMIVDLYETGEEAEPIHTSSLGDLFDVNIEAEWGDTPPGELERLRADLIETGMFRYGMGFWVMASGRHPKDAISNSSLTP